MASEALDALGLPIFITGPNGEFRWSNAAADVVLQRRDGLLDVSGSVTALDRGDGARLAESIASAAESSAARSTVVIRRATGRLPYILSVVPLARGVQQGSVLVVFRDREGSRSAAVDQLKAAFGLTTAEAEVACAIAQGVVLTEIAKARGVAVGTVRNQLKTIFTKFGVTRQIDVASIVADIHYMGR